VVSRDSVGTIERVNEAEMATQYLNVDTLSIIWSPVWGNRPPIPIRTTVYFESKHKFVNDYSAGVILKTFL
jgi:hypothetical protein